MQVSERVRGQRDVDHVSRLEGFRSVSVFVGNVSVFVGNVVLTMCGSLLTHV